VTLAQWTLAAGVVAGTLLQFVGALYVREFAKGVWVREMREEERMIRAAVAAERRDLGLDLGGGLTHVERGIGGLEVIDEEEYFDELVKA
jgi:hypothetical protein